MVSERAPIEDFFEDPTVGCTIQKEGYDQAQAAFLRELHDSLLLMTTRPVEHEVYIASSGE